MGCATKIFGFIVLIVVFILGQGQPSLGKSPSTVPSGFKAKTFYRDYSQLSPTHDHFNAMINHSINRLNYFNNALTEEPISLTHWGTSDYIIELDIGKPPKTYHLNIDTGSHLTWIQHKGCSTCIDKNKQAASYDDKNSTTSIELSCYDVECDEDGSIECDDDSGKCTYKAYYADGSNSTGLLYLDTFTFLSTDESDVVELEGVRLGGAFDCTQGAFHHDIQGVFGLSRNRRSFISQNGFLRFSHCIPSYKGMAEGPPVVRSNMMFGTAALLLGNSTAMTPHLHFYIVTLNGISVRGMRLWLDPSIFRMPNGRGRTIVDTGTPLTYIPEEAFNEVVETLEYLIKLQRVIYSGSPALCFKGNLKDVDQHVPEITLHFEGLDLPIIPRSLFYASADKVNICLAIRPMKDRDQYSIFGALLQQNVNIAFDMEEDRIFMSPMTCASII